MNYKYLMNLQIYNFIILNIFSIYIFKFYLSKILLYILYLKKILIYVSKNPQIYIKKTFINFSHLNKKKIKLLEIRN